MCSEKFPGGLIFSRGGPKLILNQVPDLWVPYFQIYKSFKYPLKCIRINMQDPGSSRSKIIDSEMKKIIGNKSKHTKEKDELSTNSVLYR